MNGMNGRATRSIPRIDGFQIVERRYSDNDALPTIGLANIHAVVPGIEQNKERILRATEIFREFGVSVAVFPEFSLSGYFWDDELACRAYMERALTEHHLDWIEGELAPMCTGELQAVVLNNLTAGTGAAFRNRTFFVSPRIDDPLDPSHAYDKVYLPGIEKRYTESGRDERLVLSGSGMEGRFGFTTCYDYLFVELLRRYSFEDRVDAIVQLASWRGVASREYPGMNVRTDVYYGDLWDTVMAASSAQHQVWTIACNAVGRHEISGAEFWGGSGIWAPSGLPLVQASRIHDELLVVHNLDIVGARRFELDDFNYEFDFREVHRQMSDAVAHEDLPAPSDPEPSADGRI